MITSAIYGAIAAFLGLFPAAFLLALFWKFPIPLFGMGSGLEASFATPMAIVFYGIFGGFVLVPGLGAAFGVIAFLITRREAARYKPLSIFLGLLCAVASCVFLITLDKFIGPW